MNRQGKAVVAMIETRGFGRGFTEAFVAAGFPLEV